MMKGIFFSLLSICAFKIAFPQAEQTLNKVVIAPPTAASLIKYADIPVNYHTGIPQIGLPLYTLKEGSLELPIGLSYHAGGIKTDEQASWVGLGFSLNAGGVITRTVRGTPDEQSTSEYGKNEKGHLSNNGYNNYLFKPDQFSPLATQDGAFLTDIAGGIRDGEPDLFFFNVNGYSGKFYFNDDGRAVLVPESDVKIDYIYTGSGSVKQFIITTPDGVKYHFGCTDNTSDTDPIELTHNFYMGEDQIFYIGTNNTIASWYLNKIVSADNQFSITLNYLPEEYSYKTVAGKPYKNDNYGGSGSNHAKYYGHWVQGVRLSSITTSSSNISVYFDAGAAREDLTDPQSANSLNDLPNTNAKSLGAIRIVNNLNDCRKFAFTYSYFASDVAGLNQPSFAGTSTADLKRLKLTQVKELKCDGTQSLPPYVFDYFTEALPRRLSFAKDHWGYINGKTTNDRLIPTVHEKAGTTNVFNEINGADRDSYWPAMRAGTLKKMTYPTGGFTEFDFEANTTYVSYTRFDKVLSFSMYAGVYGQANPNIQTRTFNSAGYTVKLTNWPTGGGAYLNGIPGLYVSASTGQTVYNQGAINAGTYQLTLEKLDAITGNGVSADVYEWVPTSIQENRVVGGLRIKTITHSDGSAHSPNIVTNYEYNLPSTQSSGHLYSRPTYVQIVRNDYLRDAGGYACCQSSEPHCSPFGYEYCSGDGYLISPNSLRPMETTQGNHIGYNEVKVSQTNNGYKIYRYYGSNAWDDIYSDVADRIVELGLPQSNDLPSFPSAPPQTDFMRGELKYDATYSQSGQLLNDSWYYPEYTENPLKTPAVVTANGAAWVGFPAFYELSTSKKTKTTIQTNTYQPGVGYVSNTVENFFNSSQHTQLSKKIEINSKGETIESNYKYAADFKPAGCVSISDGLSAYTAACATCQTQYAQDRGLPSHTTAYWYYWDYQKLLKCRSEARKTFFAARKNYFNPSVGGSFANCMATAKTNASTDLKPLFELQDKFINASIETYIKRSTKYVDAAFTKYTYATAPTGMIYPSVVQKINIASPSTTFTISSISGNNLVKDSRYADESTIVMNNGNVSQAAAKNDSPTSYIWAYNNTLPIVKASNVDYVTLQNAYTAVGGNLTLLRSHATLSNALIHTYEYRPGIGMVKETDANNRNIYYEYDAFNRLRIIKDHDNNVVKKICYNYIGQPGVCDASVFINDPQSGNFTRNNCSSGYVGSTVTYTVAQGTYFSTISLQDANAQAIADVNANGQSYADANGICSQMITVNGYNTKTSTYTVKFTNNATEAEYTFYLNANTFSPYTLGTVPAGTYKVQFSPAGSPVFATYNINNNTYYGQYGNTFYNIPITATSTASMY